ncbi:MAG: hypothetical protein FWH00_00255 [Oscillospiraceae bacterium]|nr:hypothetical protein [Oscillospiraceae bacterium]
MKKRIIILLLSFSLVLCLYFPASANPTGNMDGDSWEMKSSYGINAEVRVSMTTDGGSGSTSEVQHIIAVFPEFDFETYSLSARNLRS